MTVLSGSASTRPYPSAAIEPGIRTGDVILGIDIGGTKTAAIVVDAGDRVLGRAERATDRQAPDRVAVEVARAAMEAAGLPMGTLAAIGIAVPGDVDARTGTVRLAVNLDASDLPLGELVEDVLGVPCFVEHDARAAAVWLAARPDGVGDLAYLSIGTGIAAGVVLDGQPLAGDNGLAGEIGHCVADPDGADCPCGLRGCLEAIASGPAVAEAARAAVEAGESSLLCDLPATPITAEAVYAAAALGDPLSIRVTEAAAVAIGRAVRSLVLSYGVANVVVGGGPSRAGESFTRPLLRALEDERSASALIRRAFLGAVEVLPPDAQPTSWGAITVARLGLLRTHPMNSERRRAGPDER